MRHWWVVPFLVVMACAEENSPRFRLPEPTPEPKSACEYAVDEKEAEIQRLRELLQDATVSDCECSYAIYE